MQRKSIQIYKNIYIQNCYILTVVWTIGEVVCACPVSTSFTQTKMVNIPT